ncbi:hypothetical protein FHT60_003863 [Novosphingobium sp. BK486]|nr:hypothetical protein [Novosphingobium sp. BK256]MBB3376377.1 hypothetical protein [Novosphingobium sp. BK280]MBB3380742.1 hypothetical protein [Novosphingobium sp. BK258]MBB3422442.1 hypothetical protein [Novosphingobium sp. BK267]MBB3451093.1 hypothetical protein [Novosphingobium sp. BK352]MBB3479650.1 hypothetical protein [Novosphingobium sp. BK369]MBB3502915.1 hypothetical protein [Novosphingobium sp. BK336]MBB3538750.1 hypothetical protein [Novosphingobium sp. BK486]MBB3558097.1 hypo
MGDGCKQGQRHLRKAWYLLPDASLPQAASIAATQPALWQGGADHALFAIVHRVPGVALPQCASALLEFPRARSP